MARYSRQSNVEQVVDAYISKLRNSINIRSERPFIDKAIKILDVFIDKPCCADPAFTVAFSGRDNIITRFLRANLTESFDLRKHRQSLLRTKTLLEQTLIDPCC